jgi:glycerophosphoryl diester phosphodiesterase
VTFKKTNPLVLKAAALFLGILLFLVLLWTVLPTAADPALLRLRWQLAEDGCIIHAGGFLTLSDGTQVSYTNSLEALENCYRNGKRFCEIDLQETSDGLLICGHGDDSELVYGTGLPTTASGADFLNCRIYGEFTPLSAEGLASFMRGHPDFYVVTDVKTDNLRVCRRLAEAFPDLRGRLIVQIQLPEEYETLQELGFPFILYPIFKTPDGQRGLLHLASFARNHELLALILPNGYYSPDSKLFLAEKLIGTPFVLHTLNDDWEIAYYLRNRLAFAVYTDRIDCGLDGD